MKKLCLLFILCAQFANGQKSPYDSLELQLSLEKADTQKLQLLKELVDAAFNLDMQKALEYARQGVAFSDKINNKNWQPAFYEMEGRTHANLLHLDSASFFFNKAMKGYLLVNNKKGQATTNFKLAWVYKKRGEFDKALEKDLAALKLMETSDDDQGICDALTRISDDLIKQNRLSEALDYAQQAIDIAQKNNLSSQFYNVNFNAGNVAMAAGHFQQSLNYYNKASDIGKNENIGLIGEADLINSRGNAFKKLGRYKEAMQEYKQTLDIGKKANYPMAVSAAIANLGEVNMLMGNYKEALGYQLETVRLQEKDSDVTNLIENYNLVSQIYQHLANYKSSLKYKEKAYSLRDSIISVKSDEAMSKMLTQYEAQKNEETIASQQNEILQQRKQQWLGAGVVLLLTGLLIFSFISYHHRNKNNRIIAAKNKENELLLKEIHHRVKNNLEVVSSLLALQSAQIEDPKTKEAMQEGQNRVRSIGIVHQKLYLGKNAGAIEMKDYFLNLSESILDSFGAEDRISMELAMEKLDVDIDTAVPLGLIVNELLTNTLKYAFPEGQTGNVRIKLERKINGILHLEVSDNGIGKSGEIHGTGFGSQLLSLLTKQLSGKMREEIKNGTSTFFDFNLHKVA
jgi:two-component system, sensor histidine kinase PdtaS